MIRPEPAGAEDRQAGRRHRLRPGRHGRGPATWPRRPRGPCLRAREQAGRAAALRHSRLQDGEALHRPPRRADAGRGRHVPLRRQCRRRQDRSPSCSPSYDAVLYCGGAETPRPAGIPGGDLDGVHDAMHFLSQQNRRVGGEDIQSVAGRREPILAGGKHVVVVGGGDTGSDCVGTAFRQGAVRGHPARHPPAAAGEGRQADRLAVLGDQDAHLVLAGRRRRTRLPGGDARIHRRGRAADGVQCCEVDEKRKPIAGTEFVIRADLAFIAIGFAGPFADGVVRTRGLGCRCSTAAVDQCRGQ